MENQKNKRVSMVGFAPSWEETPWREEGEIWCLNEGYKLMEQAARQGKNPRADRWFEIHNPDSPSKNTPEHRGWLQKTHIPVYMRKICEDIPSGRLFPFDAIMEWLKERGHIGYRYFTNSISWMIAFALYEGFEEIHVYGVDMAQDAAKNGTSEYAFQKPSCEYMLGVAEKYAKVYVPETSDLLKCHTLYGIESDNESSIWVKKQMQQLTGRYKQIEQAFLQSQQAVRQNEVMMAEIRGANGAYGAMLKRRV